MGQGTQAMERKKAENRGCWNDYDREEEKPKQKTLDECLGEKK